MSGKAASSALYGTAAILLFLSLLYLLPLLLNRSSYQIEFPKTTARESNAKLPIERELPIIKGKNILPLSHRGKISLKALLEQTKRTLIVNYWATWCPPCVEELPSLEFLNRQLNSSRETAPLIVTISVDEYAEDINRFYRTLDFEPSLIVLHDLDGDMARSVGTVKFPETYWVNSNGEILHKWIGPQAWLSREVIEKLALPPN